MTAPDWKERVYKMLAETFGNDVESLTRVMFYLDKEEVQYGRGIPPALRTLKLSLSSPQAFLSYAKRLSEDTKSAENNPEFLRFMNYIWHNILNASVDTKDESYHQRWDVTRLGDENKVMTHFTVSFAHGWSIIPEISRQQIMQLIPKVISNRAIIGSIDEVVGLFNRGCGDVMMVGLAAIALAYDVWANIERWWKGEISGKRCLKNVIDSGVCIASGVSGGVAGAAIGSFLGPFGTLIGGVVGGILVGQLSSFLIDRLTQTLFGIPKEEALENAYNYFGVNIKASNNEINHAFRQKCLQHHPDKGGNVEDFHFVQFNMAVIKAAHGEMY